MLHKASSHPNHVQSHLYPAIIPVCYHATIRILMPSIMLPVVNVFLDVAAALVAACTAVTTTMMIIVSNATLPHTPTDTLLVTFFSSLAKQKDDDTIHDDIKCNAKFNPNTTGVQKNNQLHPDLFPNTMMSTLVLVVLVVLIYILALLKHP